MVGTKVELYAFGQKSFSAAALSSVSVGNQPGSAAGPPLKRSGMTTKQGTEAARRSAPRRVGGRKPKASKMSMTARLEVSEPVMSVLVGMRKDDVVGERHGDPCL